MFTSSSLTNHLIRGVAAAALIVIGTRGDLPWWLTAAAIVTAIVAMRGCPLCWLIGLYGTIATRLSGEATVPACPLPPRHPVSAKGTP